LVGKHSTTRLDWLPYVLLPAVTAVAYGRIHALGFVSVDDPAYVSQNPHVLDGITAESVRWAFTAFHSANWHPLTWLSHIVDVQLYGLHPLGHHLTSLAFHAANACLLFVLLRRLTGNRWRSLLVSALFAAHPLHVESVAWVAERKDVLSTFFFFLTLLAYVAWISRKNWLRYGALLASLGLGLLTKPMLVSAPLVLLLLDCWPLGRLVGIGNRKLGTEVRTPFTSLLTEKLPLFGLAAASCVVTFIAQRSGGAVQDLQQYSLGVRLANAAVAYIDYLLKMLWPVKLAVLYPHPGNSLPAWHVAASAVALAALTYLAARSVRNKMPYVAVGWFWYVITLLPVIGLIQVGKQAMADRYTYIPSIGVFVAVVWATADLMASLPARTRSALLGGLGTAVVLACVGLTFVQVGYWRTGITVWTRAVEVTPNDAMLHFCLADACLEEHKPTQAVPHLRKAISLKPDMASAHDLLGFVLTRQGKLREATREIRTALRLAPRTATAWNNLGGIYSQQGDVDQAIRCFRKAVKISPKYAQAQVNLAMHLEQKGLVDSAEAHYRAAIAADPRMATAHCALGSLLFGLGSVEQAERHLRRAIELRPSFPEAQVYLGAVLIRKGKPNEAISPLQEAISSEPKLGVAHYNLFMAYFQLGRYAEADDELQAAVACGVKVDPRFVRALNQRLGRQ
jgi:Flp pilus assembly protein TadD